MSRKGQRKYVCEDCKHEWMEHWTARVRAARIRCPNCGSGFHHLKTDYAKDDAASLLDVRASFNGCRQGEGGGHFVVGNDR